MNSQLHPQTERENHTKKKSRASFEQAPHNRSFLYIKTTRDYTQGREGTRRKEQEEREREKEGGRTVIHSERHENYGDKFGLD